MNGEQASAVIAAALCLGACDGPALQVQGHQFVADNSRVASANMGADRMRSGQRLAARVWVSEEGMRLPTSEFYDTQREEPCKFRRAEDGRWRCLPGIVVSDFFTARIDAACSGLVLHDPFLTSATEYVLLGPQACEMTMLGGFRNEERFFTTYRVGGAFEGQLYSDRYGTCGRWSNSFTTTPYELVDRIDPGTFVAASEAVGEPSGRLAYHQLVAEDGAALVVGWHSLDAGVDCTAIPLGGESRCVPGPVSRMTSWRGGPLPGVDGQCWDRLTHGNPCVVPRHGWALDAVFETERADAADLSEDARACFEQSRSWSEGSQYGGLTLYALTEEVAAESLEPIVSGTHSAGRLTASFGSQPDGTLPIGSSSLEDSEFGSCVLAVASDGEVRCLPGRNVGNTYADEECSVSLHTKSRDGVTWQGVHGPRANVEGILTGLDSITVYAVGELHTGPTYRRLTEQDDGCVLGETSGEVYALGAEIPPEQFVRFELQREL